MKKYLKKIKNEIILFTVGTFLSYLFYSLIPYFTKLLFEGKYGMANIGYIVCLFMFILLSYFNNIIQVKYQLKFDKILKEEYFNKVVNLNYEDFSQKRVGEYISFQANDITTIGNDYLAPLMNVITQTFRILTYLVIIALTLDLRISMILIGAAFLGVILPKRLGKETAKRRNIFLESQKHYYSKIEEIFNGFKVIDFRTRDQIINKHKRNLEEVMNDRYEYGKASSVMWSLNGLGSESINLIAFLYLGYLSLKGEITAAFAIAAFQYSQSLMEPVQEVLYNSSMLHSAQGLIKSFLEFVNSDISKKEKEAISEFTCLSIKNVDKKFDTFCLKNINLKFERGKKYAIIGDNGSGKSTLFNILASYIHIDLGDIEIDSKNIEEIETSYLLGIMNQDEYIFSDDFNDNTTLYGSYNNLDVSSFCIVEENVNKSKNCRVLSGGEKKVIALVRVLNKETPIILLDEPFSAIGEKKRNVIFDNLMSLEKTVIMITHDLDESLSKFDLIVMLKEGEIIYQLPYEMLKEKREYKELKEHVENNKS